MFFVKRIRPVPDEIATPIEPVIPDFVALLILRFSLLSFIVHAFIFRRGLRWHLFRQDVAACLVLPLVQHRLLDIHDALIFVDLFMAKNISTEQACDKERTAHF